MKTLNKILLTVVLMSFAISALAAEMGLSNGHDLDEIWARAQQQHDLDLEDAVLLLESRHVTLGPDGAASTRVHRVVWIGTSVGIRSYADLRIPWNTATSTLDVELLRTWRDGRWWPDVEAISETAVVPTLPHALNRADDYTVMRETMLLHDGVELPCIMETAYTITESGLPGADGLFVMAKRDPSMVTELKVTAPTATAINYETLNGAVEPLVTEEGGTTSILWSMTDVAPLGVPVNAAPAAYEPAVAWSTWTDWPQLRDHWLGLFDEAAVPDAALEDSVQIWIENEPSRWNRIGAVVDQVNENVRGIHYSDGYWTFTPRPAVRTWETAYGHPLDRAVLAAALLRAAGYEVTPIFVGAGHRFVAEGVARLSGLGDLHLSIKGDPAALYDPDHGVLSGQAPLIGSPLWRTDQYVDPFLGNSQWPNLLEVTVTMEPGEEGSWTGSGQFLGSGIFCPQGAMAGGSDGAHDFLAGVVGSLLPGAEVAGTNPEIFHQHQVVYGFGFDLAKAEPDDTGWTRLVVGAPRPGLLNQVGGMHLYDEVRTSPVLLAGPLEQVVRIRFLAADGEPAHLPAPVSVVNEVGEFTVTTIESGGWITVVRSLKITADSCPAEMWPQLRALLLADADPINGTILLD